MYGACHNLFRGALRNYSKNIYLKNPPVSISQNLRKIRRCTVRIGALQLVAESTWRLKPTIRTNYNICDYCTQIPFYNIYLH